MTMRCPARSRCPTRRAFELHGDAVAHREGVGKSDACAKPERDADALSLALEVNDTDADADTKGDAVPHADVDALPDAALPQAESCRTLRCRW